MRPSHTFRRLLVWMTILSNFTMTCSITAEPYDDCVKKATELLKANSFADANAEAEKAVKINGARWEAHYIQGLAAYKLDMLDLAETEFKKALEHTPEDQKPQIQDLVGLVNDKRQFLVHVKNANEAEDQALYAKAAKEYTAAWNLIKQREEIGLRAAKIWANQINDPLNALRILTYILNHPQDSTTKEEAGALFTKLSPSLESKVKELMIDGRYWLDFMHDGQKALSYFSLAAEITGRDPQPHLRLARTYALLNDSRHAIAELRIAQQLGLTKAEEILQGNEFVYIGGSPEFQTYVNDAFGEKALSWFKSDRLGPGYLRQGCEYFNHDKVSEAADSFVKAGQILDPNWKPHFLAARAYARKRDVGHTISELRSALNGQENWDWAAEDVVEFLELADDQSFSAFIAESFGPEPRKKFEANTKRYKHAVDMRHARELLSANKTSDAISLLKNIEQHAGDNVPTSEASTQNAEMYILLARAEAKANNVDGVIASLRAVPNLSAATPVQVLAEEEFNTLKQNDVFLQFVTTVFGEAARAQFQSGMTWENTLGMKFIPLRIAGNPKARNKGQGSGRLMVGVYEVRVRDYAQFLTTTGYQRSSGWAAESHFEAYPDHPVANVTCDDCHAFCSWLSKKEGLKYRLLTDKEWTYAAAVGKNNWWFFGKNWAPLPDCENLKGIEFGLPIEKDKKNSSQLIIEEFSDGYKYTAPVGSFRANAQGLHDIGGNVSEWTGTSQILYYIIRGASWNVTQARLADRNSCMHNQRLEWLGFRCAVEGVSFPPP